jgi:hypothetical protein
MSMSANSEPGVRAAQLLQLAVRGGRRQLHDAAAGAVGAVLEDVTHLVAGRALQEDDGVDAVERTGRIVSAAGGDPSQGDA